MAESRISEHGTRHYYLPVATPSLRYKPDEVPDATGETYRVSDIVVTSKQGGQLGSKMSNVFESSKHNTFRIDKTDREIVICRSSSTCKTTTSLSASTADTETQVRQNIQFCNNSEQGIIRGNNLVEGQSGLIQWEAFE